MEGRAPAAGDCTKLVAVPARVSSSDFIGRRDELARLEAIWKSAVSDERAKTVLIAGEAGVGKSRLVHELAARLPQPAFVFVGQSVELVDRALPFGPVVQILRTMHRTLDDATLEAVFGPARDELGRLLPELHVEARQSVDGGALFEQLLGVFERLSEYVPTLLVLEDLHWADTSTRELFVFLARTLYAARMVLVGTYRSDDLHRRHPLRPVLAELDRSGLVERIDLARFDRDEMRDLIEAILGQEPASDLVDRTYERSDGNAFFAEELLAARAMYGDAVPPTLRDIVLARVDPLADDVLQVLRCAAVVGRSVDHRLLAAIADLPDDRLRAAVREAVAQQILVTDGDALEYRFRHALVQEAVEDDVLPGDRVALHTRVAEVLAQRPSWFDGGDAHLAAELACHWNAAGDTSRALEAAYDAACAAERIYAYAEALAHAERVLALWPQVPDAAQRIGITHVELMRYAAKQAEMYGSADRALDYINGALAEVDPEVDPVTAALLHERAGRYIWSLSGAWADILGHCEEAVRLVPPEPSLARAQVVATLGQHLMLAGRPESVDVCREAIEVAQEVGAPVIEGHARNSLGAMLCNLGRTDEGLAELHHARELAIQTGSWVDVARAAVNEGGALGALMRHEEALALSLEGAELSHAHGLDRSHGAFLRLNANESLWELGRWCEFEEQLSEVEAISPIGFDQWRIAFQKGLLAAARKQFDAARSVTAGMAAHFTRDGVVHDEHSMEYLQAMIARWEGDLRTTVAIASKLGASERGETSACSDHGVEVLGEGIGAAATLAATTGDAMARDSARALAATLEDWIADERWNGGWAGDVGAMRALFAAEVARAEQSDTAEQWADVAGRWDSFKLRPRAAYARARAAEVAYRDGDRVGAERFAKEAYDDAVDIGWIILRDDIASFARRARLDIGATDTAPTAAERFGLTAREIDVLRLVADGRTNRQIGEALFISAKTASVHVSNILTKLGVSNRGEAAAAARRLGLDLEPASS